MLVRKIIKQDLLDLWLWRNDKKSIFFSKNQIKITFESHKKWFKKNLTNTRVKFFLGYLIEKNGILQLFFQALVSYMITNKDVQEMNLKLWQRLRFEAERQPLINVAFLNTKAYL